MRSASEGERLLSGAAAALARLYDAVVEPSDGLEPSTPSLPWKCSTS